MGRCPVRCENSPQAVDIRWPYRCYEHQHSTFKNPGRGCKAEPLIRRDAELSAAAPSNSGVGFLALRIICSAPTAIS
jgi:hypothetical protein